jgi:site-specific recombinase XerD
VGILTESSVVCRQFRQLLEKWVRQNHLAQSSIAKYDYNVRAFRSWCVNVGLNPDEVSFENVATFILSGHTRGLSYSAILGQISSISDLFKYNNTDENPTKDPLMKGILESVRRNSIAPARRNPVTNDHFDKLVPLVDKGNFLDVRNHLIFCMMFKGLLRSMSPASLLENEVWLEDVDGEEVLFIFLRTSKVDQYQYGHTVMIGKGKSEASCTIFWFKIYIKLRRKGAAAFFHQNHTQNKWKRKFLTPSTINSIFKRSLAKAGITDYLTSHSLRAGGATAAIKQGVDLRLVKHQGQWKSDCVYLYITESVKNILSVSKSF